ncbi:hypothetical protein LCGC14_3141940 [marine sediment metagenome]|uniref:B12-binding domain-containing protein n=1 Tax=marine sediment metagenome TaxID=412755 RepID=A0A0F8Y3F4_9ZZZZ
MKIVLINPSIKTWSPNIYAPLGLAYIAKALEDANHSVKILDLNSQKMSDSKLIEQLVDADIIGITGMVTEYKEVVRLTEIVWEANPMAKIILGGALATTHTEQVLIASFADYAIIGEGEQTIVELVSAFKQGKDYKNIKSIACKDGEVHFSPKPDIPPPCISKYFGSLHDHLRR